MAIAEMSKLRLFGISYEKQKLLNELSRTGAVQIKEIERDVPEESNTEIADTAHTVLSQKLVDYEQTADFIKDVAAEVDRRDRQAERLPTYQFVTYDEFASILTKEEELRMVVSQVTGLREEKAEHDAERNKLQNLLQQIRIYANIDVTFSRIRDTRHTFLTLGTISSEGYRGLKSYVDTLELTYLETCGMTPQGGYVVFLAAHRSEGEALAGKLSELGFSKCPFDFNLTVSEKLNEIGERIRELNEADRLIRKQVYAYKSRWSDLKILIDRLTFELEKIDSAKNFRTTRTTFELEAYVPKANQEQVKEAIDGVTEAAYYEFLQPDEADNPPTLMRNNKVTRQFEFITNMYSVPNYRELDPNTVMSIFFMLFFGLIMADIGYGIVLLVGCLFLAGRNKRDTGSRRLLYIFALGGIMTIIFGIVFGSFFGFTHETLSWIPVSLLPDPQMESEKFLIYCLGIGIIQIFVGFVMKGIQEARRGSVLDGIFDGFLWSFFFAGILILAMAIFQEVLGISLPDNFLYLGAVICLGVIVIEMFAAGRKSKGFSKLTKGFGALYGIVNYFSDILSYVRLFGLMLSGAIIAGIVSDMSYSMIVDGGFGAVGGIIIFIIGHVFNLAMNLLGAYIHDSRLQYIEFFSKFYEGDGDLFTPLGSNFKYVELIREKTV